MTTTNPAPCTCKPSAGKGSKLPRHGKKCLAYQALLADTPPTPVEGVVQDIAEATAYDAPQDNVTPSTPAAEPKEELDERNEPLDERNEPLDGKAVHPGLSRARARARAQEVIDDPRKSALRYKCWAMMVRGDRPSEIAAALNLSPHTVRLYAREEAQERAQEVVADRDLEIQTALEEYRGIIRWHRDLMKSNQASGNEGAIIIKARERIDKLLGLDIPVKAVSEQGRSALLESLGHEAAAAILKMLGERRALRP